MCLWKKLKKKLAKKIFFRKRECAYGKVSEDIEAGHPGEVRT